MSDNQEKSPTPAKFPVGAAVRVKDGTMDPDFTDIPIGGWAGTIQESDPPMYLVEWHQFTLDQMNPIYCKRCDRDGLDIETMWLDENDLEPDSRELVKVEQPNALIYLPLSPENQDENEGTVPDFLGRMPFNLPSSFPKGRLSFRVALVLVLFWGTAIGIVVGSLVASMQSALIVPVLGAMVLGFLGLSLGSGLGRILGRLNQVKFGAFWGGLVGGTGGGIAGALFGAMVMAIVGVLIGGFLGAMASSLVLAGRKKASSIFLGAMIGATVQAFLLDQEKAFVGAIYGGVIGAGVAFLAIIGLRFLASLRQSR